MALQVVLVILLLVAIGWSAMLHRRLRALRQGGDGIGRFVCELVGAAGRAETATRQMREVSADLARRWQQQRAESDGLTAELRRLSGDAGVVLRELRSLPMQAVRERPDERDTPGTDRMAQAPDPLQHERIRQAVRDLR